MAYSHVPFDSLQDDKEFALSPLQAPGASAWTDRLNPSGYEHLELDDGGGISVRAGANRRSSPNSSVNSLRIFPGQEARVVSVHRVSPAEKSPEISAAEAEAEAASPVSNRHLLDSPAGSNGMSPTSSSAWTGPKTTSIFERLMPRKGTEETASLRENAGPFSYSPAPNTPMGVPINNRNSPSSDAEPGRDDSDTDAWKKRYSAPPSYCKARQGIWTGKKDGIMMALAVYPLVVGSFLLAVAIWQPALPFVGPMDQIEASTAVSVVSFVAKSVEVSFAGAFLFCLGQALSLRSISRMTMGVTLSEMNMRNWLYSPGMIISHYKSSWFSVRSLLGATTLFASLGVFLYTTAIGTMVAPKLKQMPVQHRMLDGEFWTSYGNVYYGKQKCPVLFGKGNEDDAWGCTSVEFCGSSYTDLLAFMQRWEKTQKGRASKSFDQRSRPNVTSLLDGNKSMLASWIETRSTQRNVTAMYERHGRIIDNVTMALPHPGVYKAVGLPSNNMPHVRENSFAQVVVNARVVSPSLNVMCVNMKKEELRPLVYTSWPYSKNVKSRAPGLMVPADGWALRSPPWGEDGKEGSVPNKTVVDDIFRWGPKYGRTPPMIAAYPPPLNVVSNLTIRGADAVYILAKHPDIADYTLCEARSWLSTLCSTEAVISGASTSYLRSVCEGDANTFAYSGVSPGSDVIASNWSTSMDMNGGLHVSNASNGRILSQLILREPTLSPYLPSIAEALSAYMASTLVMASIDSPFQRGWDYPNKMLDEPGTQQFFAQILTTQYAAGHTEEWQKVWYCVLFIVPALSLFCVLYMWYNGGVVTDFTEPKTLFALALNSPPSVQIHGSCGSGPTGRDLVVPWRVSYEPELKHFYFEEANNRPWRGRYSRQAFQVPGPGGDAIGASYNALSASRLRL
ncbi:uncharacterized protein MAM_06943 [Metarhizium album ARSEF 1941]|uniref:Uncharacterized protein n=1 Tax=Metarhizium album (strain ARSEF 1941) TaxID=1081103 RepID=A0A0B2WP18_METAS|nr:uncharacterized protein MAM_06943 [Metarhizium album ARSEF 1941]KHN95232.1 hypothetical protein MAM_06943 [Metarhizium album ARSEF 1941]